MGDIIGKVTATRRIAAPAGVVFRIISDPATHPSFDGSGMLIDATGNTAISSTGDVFRVHMRNDEMGEYGMDNQVVEFEADRRIAWEPVLAWAARGEYEDGIGDSAKQLWGYELEPDGSAATVVTELFDCRESPEWLRTAVKEGTRWLEAMNESLEKLDKVAVEAYQAQLH